MLFASKFKNRYASHWDHHHWNENPTKLAGQYLSHTTLIQDSDDVWLWFRRWVPHKTFRSIPSIQHAFKTLANHDPPLDYDSQVTILEESLYNSIQWKRSWVVQFCFWCACSANHNSLREHDVQVAIQHPPPSTLRLSFLATLWDFLSILAALPPISSSLSYSLDPHSLICSFSNSSHASRPLYIIPDSLPSISSCLHSRYSSGLSGRDSYVPRQKGLCRVQKNGSDGTVAQTQTWNKDWCACELIVNWLETDCKVAHTPQWRF